MSTSEKIASLEQDHSSLPFFGYFLKVELELPYSTLFAMGHTLTLIESLPVLSNLMAQIGAPAFDADAPAEELCEVGGCLNAHARQRSPLESAY